MADREQAAPGIVLPQPADITQREKDDAMASYLMMFASWAVGLPLPLVNLVASVVYYAVNRKSSKFVAFHALQSFLSQVPVSLLNAGVVGWGIGLLVKGEAAGSLWPFLSRLAIDRHYGPSPAEREQPAWVNRPPEGI